MLPLRFSPLGLFSLPGLTGRSDPEGSLPDQFLRDRLIGEGAVGVKNRRCEHQRLVATSVGACLRPGEAVEVGEPMARERRARSPALSDSDLSPERSQIRVLLEGGFDGSIAVLLAHSRW